MRRPPGCAGRYSASFSSHRHSLGPMPAMSDRASCGFLQRGQSGDGRGKLASVLRSRLGRMAGGKSVQHLAKTVLGQVLVGVLPDQYHRRVHAGAETLDLFAAEIAVLGEMEGIVVDAALADFDDVARAAQAARRRAADLDVGLLADRLQLKHRVEGR